MHIFKNKIQTRISKLSIVKELQLSNESRIKNLDGVRGIAILIVIASHTDAFHLARQGAVGVWIFFALSGFLLFMPFVKAPESILSTSKLKRYLLRRIKRIIPIYYITLTFILLLSNYDVIWYLKHITFLQADIHFWTVRQELFFYMLLPFIAFLYYLFVKKFNPKIFILLLFLVAPVLQYFFNYLHLNLNIPGTETIYITPFLFGIGFCILHFKTKLKINKWISPISLVVILITNYYLVSLFFSFTGYKYEGGSLPWEYPVVFGLIAAIFVFSSVYKNALDWLLGSNILRLIGKISYSLYIFHWFIIAFAVKLGISMGIQAFVFTLIIGIILSYASYLYIEKPFIERKN